MAATGSGLSTRVMGRDSAREGGSVGEGFEVVVDRRCDVLPAFVGQVDEMVVAIPDCPLVHQDVLPAGSVREL